MTARHTFIDEHQRVVRPPILSRGRLEQRMIHIVLYALACAIMSSVFSSTWVRQHQLPRFSSRWAKYHSCRHVVQWTLSPWHSFI